MKCRKIIIIILIVICLISIVSCTSPQTISQIYGTPVRVDYESYHSAIIYFTSGEPLYVTTDDAVVWEKLLYSHHKFSVLPRHHSIWSKLYGIDD